MMRRNSEMTIGPPIDNIKLQGQHTSGQDDAAAHLVTRMKIFPRSRPAAGYKGTKSAEDLYKLQYTWRILMGLGILIPLSVFYFR
jgi:hypothetical protein